MQQLNQGFSKALNLPEVINLPAEKIKQRLLDMCNKGILNSTTKQKLLNNELSVDCLQLLNKMADIYDKNEFPNKFCERPIFEKVFHHGHEVEELTGYIRWHSDNPGNRIKLMLKEYKEIEIKENNKTWNKQLKKTEGLIEKEKYFNELKENKIGSKMHEEKIAESVRVEDVRVIQEALF